MQLLEQFLRIDPAEIPQPRPQASAAGQGPQAGPRVRRRCRGRRRPVAIEGSEAIFDFDTVIVAIGNKPNPLIPQTMPELETTTRQSGNVAVGSIGISIGGIVPGGR